MSPSYAVIMAAGWDAGDRSMRAAGRIAWSEADWDAAAEATSKLFALASQEIAHNAGARIADDCFCPGCGARGHQFTCPRCARELAGR